MSNDGNTVWSIAGVAGLAVGVTILAFTVARIRLRARILAHGLVTDATCLDTYVTVGTHGTGEDRRPSGERHVIIGFRPEDGRDVRFRDTSGVPFVKGDRMQVRYLPHRPQRALTADRHPSGINGPLAAAAVAGLLVVAFGVVGTGLGLRDAPEDAAGVTVPAPSASHTPPFPGSGWAPGGLPTSAVCVDGHGPQPLCPSP
ncbi:DUF3592 domain-containing protein [Kitasatospora sp. NPDC059747]|uniref:DUF3592 domain-containing protein n=1 Tax=Kitasatospora sp. NPDC059747 TaxID=3346930 RepID=UPI0036698BE4